MSWGNAEWHYRCPGCGLEPEVEDYLRDKLTKERVGYICRCGAEVINGVVNIFHGPNR